ncbi:YkgJ family cysteine cluster protein [Tepidiforma sp.]|uniref:YkgJ family cysteine cluster protein n=1 Tax=Tepidiforma sp. TaxID=2682230 RepID=UPI002ADDA934|nr:YkgJ family cysteine cluster protein [Tepidiforma sp.]
MALAAAQAPTLERRMRAAWQDAAPRFTAYHLVLPGSPSFVCQVDTCEAACCRAFSVAMHDRDVERFARLTGLQPIHFLETEDNEPIRLPLAQPYLLARDDGHCRFLQPRHHCGAYEARPTACRLYPHFVIYWNTQTSRPVYQDPPPLQAIAASGAIVPLLLGHDHCPGFTGPPLTPEAWLQLLTETDHLQRNLA